ncbi:MAG: tetratricopeptide repeat protein [Pseudomonadota bacterium]
MQAVDEFAHDVALIDGTAAFGQEVPPVARVDILDTTPAMRAFATQATHGTHLGYWRVKRLLAVMMEDGFFTNSYRQDATYTASGTFDNQMGNCLAYTNLFIALARSLGIEAEYQMIDKQPTFDVDGEFIVRSNHINVVLPGIRLPGELHQKMTVDFNVARPDLFASARRITDAQAEALFYINLGVTHLYEREDREAFAYLRRAIMIDPVSQDAWNNLAALYSKRGQHAAAVKAYRNVLALAPNTQGALAGMARSLRVIGKNVEADAYAVRVRRYVERNPFYHFAEALKSIKSEAYTEALTAIERAIDLERKNPRFYQTRAIAAAGLGDQQLARLSLKKADLYQARLKRLESDLIHHYN